MLRRVCRHRGRKDRLDRLALSGLLALLALLVRKALLERRADPPGLKDYKARSDHLAQPERMELTELTEQQVRLELTELIQQCPDPLAQLVHKVRPELQGLLTR
jgi:hypothetical protein